MTAVDGRVADLLGSPTAVYFLACATVGYSSLDDLPTERPNVETSELGRSLDDPIRLLMTVFRYIDDWPDNGHAQQHSSSLAEHAELFEAAARAVATSRAAAWWWQPLDRAAQTWLSASASEVAPIPFDVKLDPDPLAPCRPSRALMTSTRIGALASTWLFNAWDGLESPPFSVWHVSVQPGARVYEVHGKEDWERLVERYPAEADGTWVPDWQTVVDDFDGVHLSMAGFLGASYVTSCRHWGTEATVWLRPVLDGATRLADWTAPVPYAGNAWPPPEWP
jgi:hypothetical protein